MASNILRSPLLWIGLTIGLVGFLFLVWTSPSIAIGIALIQWGSNIEKAAKSR